MCRKVGIDKTKGSTSSLQRLQKVNNGKFFLLIVSQPFFLKVGKPGNIVRAAKLYMGNKKCFLISWEEFLSPGEEMLSGFLPQGMLTC